MSSLTMASRISRRPLSPPVDSSAKLGLPGWRRAAACATKAAAASRAASSKPSVSPGSAPAVSTAAISRTRASVPSVSVPEVVSLATDAVIAFPLLARFRPVFGADFAADMRP